MICFTWWGLTQYAARAIEAFNKVSREPVCVVATRPQSSPVKGMEKILSCPLVWVSEHEVDFIDKLPEVPRVLFVSNWNLPAWQYLEKIVRGRNGKIVAMVDTNFELFGNGGLIKKASFFVRQLLRAIRFRVCIRNRFDHFFVVGKGGHRLMRFYGVPDNCVSLGLYGADDSLFHDGTPLPDRSKRIIYVGQFIERKNIRRLIQAFMLANEKLRDSAEPNAWQLDLFGAGVLHDELSKTVEQSANRSIHIHQFRQPEDLAKEYRNARVFCLPSFEEHWGVVVHEAALSGCALLLANGVGAAEDFLGAENGISFSPSSVGEMTNAIARVMTWSDEHWIRAQSESIRLASGFGLSKFVKSALEICTSNDVATSRAVGDREMV